MLVMKLVSAVTLALLPFALFCHNRNGPVSPRDNLYDSGGNNWLCDGRPLITGTVDSQWCDYDRETGYGSIRLTVKPDDPNLPHDTLDFRAFIGNDSAMMRELLPETDSTFILTGLVPGGIYRCSLLVTDAWDSTGTADIPITLPVILPPPPPKPTLFSDTASIRIIWKPVPGATAYSVYRAGIRSGPFMPETAIAQPAKGTDAALDINVPVNDYLPRWYIIASVNPAGESRCRDTLYGRITSTEVKKPSIDSVSQGTQVDCITTSWHRTSTAISRYEIYRSVAGDSTFRLIAVVDAAPLANDYRDSVTTTEPFYYKIAAIDNNNRASVLSESKSGFSYRESDAPRLTVAGYPYYLELSWTIGQGRYRYSVYRSSVGCTDGMTRIATLSSHDYRDSVTSTDTFYYYVAVIDSTGREGVRSCCLAGNLSILPPPTGLKAIRTDAKIITLQWNTVPAAAGYAVYRSTKGCPGATDTYAAANVPRFDDTVSPAGIYYYAVAAIDKAQRSGMMSTCYKAGKNLLTSPTGFTVSNGTYPEVIVLKWDRLTDAVHYKLSRSKGSCSGTLTEIATVAATVFSDSVRTNDLYSYSVSGVDNSGAAGSPSECRSGRVQQLEAPKDVKASGGIYRNRILLSWGTVTGARGYVIYRGTASDEKNALPVDTIIAAGYSDTITNTTIYYYRVAAYNRTGIGIRSDYVKGWVLAPPHPPILKATTSKTVISLSWQFDGTATKYVIYRSIDTIHFAVIDSTTGKSYDNAPPGYTAFYYKISAVSANNERVMSNMAAGCKIFPVPDGFTGTDHAKGVLLQWKGVAGAAGYIIYRSESASDKVFYRTVSDTRFFDSLTTTTRYYYRVAAANNYQTGPATSYVTGGIIQAPSAPFVGVTGTTMAIILSYTVSASASGPTGYHIYRSTSVDGIYSLIDSTAEKVYIDSVPDLAVYYYKVTAYNDGGIGPFSKIVSGKRTPPPPPGNVAASTAYSNYIRISWKPVANATGYTVYRGNESQNREIIGTSTDTFFLDSTVPVNTSMGYCVSTVIGINKGNERACTQGNRFGPPAMVYTIPRLNGICVNWQRVPSASMYFIYRSGSPDGTFTIIDSSGTETYLDSNDIAGDNYYRIAARSIDTSDLSIVSEKARRQYPSTPASISATGGTDSNTVAIAWDSSAWASGYRLYRSTSDSFAVGIAVYATTTTCSYRDTVPSDSFYYYKVKAFNKGGESSLSGRTARGFRTPQNVPEQPSGLDTTITGSSVLLTWMMPSQTIAWSGFTIYRSDNSDSLYTLIHSTDQTYFTDQPPGSFPSVYWYKVAAYNQKGESSLTAAVAGTRY